MIDLGFVSSSFLRIGAACVFALGAFIAVFSIEQQTAVPMTAAVIEPNTTTTSLLIIETTYPVQRWHVQMRGVDVTATKKDAQRFEDQISGDPTQCFIHAESADALNAAPAALRWQYAEKSGVIWGEGSVAGSLSSSTSSSTSDRAK